VVPSSEKKTSFEIQEASFGKGVRPENGFGIKSEI